MRFKNDKQRKAMFAKLSSPMSTVRSEATSHINKFSVFDRFRSDDYLINKQNELAFKINERGDDYSANDISDMSNKLNKLNTKIRGREERETYEEGHGPIRRVLDSAVDIVHEPKPEYSRAVFAKEPNEDIRKHKLMPEDLKVKIPKLYSQENEKDPTVYAKYFTPRSNWTWYATEFDGTDRFFGLVIGFEPELGYFSLDEMANVVGADGMPEVERDMYFSPKKLSEVKKSEGI
jgi:hypothetical protein